MKKLWLFLLLLVCGISLAGCNFKSDKIIDWDWMVNEVNEPVINEPIVDGPEIVDDVELQESELFEIEKLKQSFTWDIIDWTNLGTVEITQDNTLYFNDKFWFAVILWKEWNWWKIEAKTHNEQFWEKAISWSIAFTKKWFDYANYGLGINKNDKYDDMKRHKEFWTEEDYEKATKWRNNKYYFIGNVGGFISPSMDTSEKLDPNLFPDWFIFYDVE